MTYDNVHHHCNVSLKADRDVHTRMVLQSFYDFPEPGNSNGLFDRVITFDTLGAQSEGRVLNVGH